MEQHTSIRACTSYNEFSDILEMLGCCNQQGSVVWWQLLHNTDIPEAWFSNLKTHKTHLDN